MSNSFSQPFIQIHIIISVSRNNYDAISREAKEQKEVSLVSSRQYIVFLLLIYVFILFTWMCIIHVNVCVCTICVNVRVFFTWIYSLIRTPQVIKFPKVLG